LFQNGTPHGLAATNTTLVISNVAPGQAGNWTVRASNSAGVTVSQPFNLAVLPVPPSNDSFANRALLVGSNLVSGYNYGATKEAGEPNHAFANGGRSVWYSWTAPQTAKYFAVAEDLTGSSGGLLGVYTGNSVSGLTTVGSDTASSTFTNGVLVYTARAIFDAIAGTTYAVAIDTSFGTGTRFSLGMELIPPPPNDAFANRIFISGPSVTVSGNNLAATREPGEPDTGFVNGSNSVWWVWTAPRTGIAAVNTDASSFGPLVSIFTGSTLASLSQVTNNLFADDEALRFPAIEGTSYVIAVDGFFGMAGDIVLNVATLASTLSAVIDANGLPSFTLTGSAGMDYVIQTSTNLVNWRSVSTNRVAPNGLIQLPERLSTNGPARFFRAILP
jgi:hypothetical protein